MSVFLQLAFPAPEMNDPVSALSSQVEQPYLSKPFANSMPVLLSLEFQRYVIILYSLLPVCAEYIINACFIGQFNNSAAPVDFGNRDSAVYIKFSFIFF